MKIQDQCKWPPKIMVATLKCMAASVHLKQKYALNRNICQIHFIYTTYEYKCSSKKQRIHWEWLAATAFVHIFRKIKKLCTLKRNCSLRLITVTYKEKYFLRNNQSTLDHSLLLRFFSYYFTKIFVRLSVIATVFYFSVYKLIGWDPKSTDEHKKKK